MFAFILACAMASLQSNEIEYEKMIALIKQNQEFDSLTFLYEGEEIISEKHRKPGSSPVVKNYQGIYAIRSDNARFLDVYFRDNNKNTLGHNRYSILNGKKGVYRANPGEIPSRKNVKFEATSQVTLHNTYSPEYFLFFSYFPMFKSGVEIFKNGYSFEGIESVNGIKCIKIRMDFLRGTPKQKNNYNDYWLDPERGFQVVKSVNYMFGGTASITDQIDIKRFEATDGRIYWFPTSARKQTFVEAPNKLSNDPVFVNNLRIVSGSLVINKQYDDKYFSIFSPLAAKKNSALERLEKEFQSSSKVPVNESDIQQVLNNQMNEAELQKRELQASSPSQSTGKWSYLSIFLVLIGASIVGYRLLNKVARR